MPTELILTINGASDVPSQVRVPLGRFTIGRATDNDLVINLPGLARRHAVINHFEGYAQIADSGSPDGTFVNDRPVSTAVLNDGDVVSFGAICQIAVHLQQPGAASRTGSTSTTPLPLSPPRPTRSSASSAQDLIRPAQRSSSAPHLPGMSRPPLLALASAGIILLGAVLLIVAIKWNGKDTNLDNGREPVPSQVPPGLVTPTLAQSKSTHPCAGLTVTQVSRAAEQAIRRVSNDSQRYAFPTDQAPLVKIKETIERNCQSQTIGAALHRLNQASRSLREWSANQIDPYLLAYAALAETVGTNDDPVQAARRIAPQLIAVRTILQDSNAESTLIFLAAYKMGSPGRGTHPILESMKKARLNPDTERNVWMLYNRQGLSETQYNFVIRFLAFGIIAHNPRQFGITATALAF